MALFPRAAPYRWACRSFSGDLLDEHGCIMACSGSNSSARCCRPDDTWWSKCGDLCSGCHVFPPCLGCYLRLGDRLVHFRCWLVLAGLSRLEKASHSGLSTRVHRSAAGTPLMRMLTEATPLVDEIFSRRSLKSNKQQGQ